MLPRNPRHERKVCGVAIDPPTLLANDLNDLLNAHNVLQPGQSSRATRRPIAPPVQLAVGIATIGGFKEPVERRRRYAQCLGGVCRG